MEFIEAKIREKNQAGVYKLSFDDKWFYIGSSNNLRRRMYSWKHAITHPNGFKKSLSIKSILPFVSVIRFEVIMECDNGDTAIQFETENIINNWGNPYLINICPTGASTTGIDISKRIKPVHQLNRDHEIIATHRNYIIAAESIDCNPAFMFKFLKGHTTYNNTKLKGYIFKYT